MPDFPATDPLFLSTLSLRRATPRPSPSCHPVWDFYPRSPCGERPGTIGAAAGTAAISIHALLAESDSRVFMLMPSMRYFYPRSPCGERLWAAKGRNGQKYFYPRSPCGERLWVLRKVPILSIFLSTLSLRRATATAYTAGVAAGISIHALLAESDPLSQHFALPQIHISIHALLAESDQGRGARHKRETISIHALLAESDFMLESNAPTPTVFLSTLSLRRATRAIIVFGCTFRFLSTLSLRRATISHFQTLT